MQTVSEICIAGAAAQAEKYHQAVGASDWPAAALAMAAWQTYRQMLLLWTTHAMKERV